MIRGHFKNRHPDGQFTKKTHRDQVLEESVLKQLSESNRFSGTEISVCVVRGEVVLRGEVSTWYRKQLAQETVLVIAKVQFVQNLITVKAG